MNREITCSRIKIRGMLRRSIERAKTWKAERMRREIAFSSFAPRICEATVVSAWQTPSLMKVKIIKSEVPRVKTRRWRPPFITRRCAAKDQAEMAIPRPMERGIPTLSISLRSERLSFRWCVL